MNNLKTILATGVLAASCLWISGCASGPSGKTSMTKEEILMHPDVKNRPPQVYAKNVDEVRQAGLRALTFIGCEIKTQEPLFLSGRRPNKMGLFVGSGGETVNVLLYPQSDTETHVWVETHKSFFGIAGQQGWNKQLADQMTELLNTSPGAK